MTKEEWARVEEALSGSYGMATLMVEGRKVTFSRGMITKNRLGITTYIDGIFKGVWVLPHNEHAEQRYLKHVSKYLYPAKFRLEAKKWSKHKKKILSPFDPNAKTYIYSPIWNNVTEIRRHYQKTFQDIKLVEAIG